ncbi:uncharacterized protein LOC115760193 [Drosophila novamexicana]|uniref:uncharacterized protein LOC115760193 n=1 Tax=Drosophila novamexicana TaxID=47314 RepID=UPI0011E5ED0B|nr:uncharacterized protein LOC115760193 [Drosophila novamexicana]XP_030557296.1 uncharacterized protein LOC115760193 [Drosophila novamexicana]
MEEQNRVNLLWSCAKELSTQTHAERLLKSYYINVSRKLARHNVQLPEDSVGPARMCARCGNQWCDGNYELHLRPQRLLDNAKRRRLIAQLDAVKAKQQRGMLSTGARKRANWLKKRMASHVAVDCGFCGHKTMLPLEKPKKRAKSERVETMATAAASATTTTTAAAPATGKRKKKHTNKDVSAGLKIPMPTAQVQQKQKAPRAPTTTTAAKKATTTTTTTTTTGQSNKQKKKSKAAPTPAVSNPQKMQSKTQKQNALLQLAAQLKTHASQNANKTQQNRLQALLK